MKWSAHSSRRVCRVTLLSTVIALAMVASLVFPAGARAGALFEANTFSVAGVSAGGTNTGTTVSFLQKYDVVPLVFVLMDTADGEVALRIDNVTREGFDAYQVHHRGDGTNAGTDLSGHSIAASSSDLTYVAIVPGRYEIDGAVIEAGSVEASGNKSYQSVTFDTAYSAAPSVQTNIQTMNNEALVGATGTGGMSDPWRVTGMPNDGGANGGAVKTTGFKVGLDRMQVTDGVSAPQSETIGWLAVSAGHGTLTGTGYSLEDPSSTAITAEYDSQITANAVTHTLYTANFTTAFPTGSNPIVMSGPTTIDGSDGYWVERATVTDASVQLRAREDTWLDTEVGHANEALSLLAFESSLKAFVDPQEVFWDNGDTTTDLASTGGTGDGLWGSNVNWRNNNTDPQNSPPNNVLPGLYDVVNISLNNGSVGSGSSQYTPVTIEAGDDFEVDSMRIGINPGLSVGGHGDLIIDGGELRVYDHSADSATATVGTSPQPDRGSVNLGYDTRTGTITVNSGKLDVGADLVLGVESGSAGILTVNGGEVLVGGDLSLVPAGSTATVTVGGSGSLAVTGNITQGSGLATINVDAIDGLTVGGTSITAYQFNVGHTSGSNGRFTLTTGQTLNTTDQRIIIGEAGTGEFIQQAGSTVNIGTGSNQNIVVGGNNNSGQGTYTMEGGQLNVSLDLNVGNVTTALSTFDQQNGTVIVDGNVQLAAGSAGNGNATYLLKGGTLDVGADLRIGQTTGGVGVFTQTGGTLTVGGAITDGAGTGTINLEGGTLATSSTNITVDNFNINPTASNSSSVTYTRTGGTFTVNDTLKLGGSANSGSNYRGNLNQNGGDVIVNGDLVFGGVSGREGGTYNLNSGTLTVYGDIVETTSSVDGAQMHLNGGTLAMPNGATTSTVTVQRFSVAETTNTNVTYTANVPITTTGTLAVGGFGNAIGVMIIDDDTYPTNASNVRIGQGNTANGTLRVEGTGILNVTSGPLEIAGDTTGSGDQNTTGALIVGTSGGGDTPQVNVTGRTSVGRSGTGSLTIYSGVFSQLTANLQIADGATSSGSVSLEGGALDLNNHNIVFGSGAGSFNFTGGRLEDVGTFGGTLAQQGGTLAPGDSPGVTTIDGDYVVTGGGVLEIEFDAPTTAGSGFDQLVVNGLVDLQDARLEVILGYVPIFGDGIVIVDNDGGDAVVGLFKDDNTGLVLSESDTFFVDNPNGYASQFAISYLGGTGNDIVLSAVPEPSTLVALLGLAATGLLIYRRRRRG